MTTCRLAGSWGRTSDFSRRTKQWRRRCQCSRSSLSWPWNCWENREPEPNSSSRPITRSCAISSSAWLSTGVPLSASLSDPRAIDAASARTAWVRFARGFLTMCDSSMTSARGRGEGELLAVVGDELVVEDRDVGPRRDGAAAGDDRDRAVRQPVRGLTLPPELHRRRADDDRRERVVGLERGERLDGLAKPLLVGEERAARIEHVVHPGPLERRERAAEHRGGGVDRLRLTCAGAADRVGCGVALGEQPGKHLVGRLRHLHLVAGDEAVKFVGEPRVKRDGARPLRARQLLERRPDVGIPDDLEAELLAVDAAEPHEPRRGRGLAGLDDRHAAVGGRVGAGGLLLAQDGGHLLGQRGQKAAVVLDDDRLELLGERSGERLEDEPAAPVVPGGPDVPDPPLADRRQPFGDVRRRRQLRVALEHLDDLHPRPVAGRRGPLAGVPVEAPERDRAHERDPTRVVREREDDERLAAGAPAQLDVRAFGRGLRGGAQAVTAGWFARAAAEARPRSWRSSAIWTAFVAAPLRRLSPTTHMFR